MTNFRFMSPKKISLQSVFLLASLDKSNSIEQVLICCDNSLIPSNAFFAHTKNSFENRFVFSKTNKESSDFSMRETISSSNFLFTSISSSLYNSSLFSFGTKVLLFFVQKIRNKLRKNSSCSSAFGSVGISSGWSWDLSWFAQKKSAHFFCQSSIKLGSSSKWEIIFSSIQDFRFSE